MNPIAPPTQTNPSSLLEINTNSLLPVEFNAATPINYWVEGANIPPDEARERVERLSLYRDLYDGDHSSLSYPLQRNVRVNYFARVADYYADTLTFSPPEFTPELDEKVLIQLMDAVYHVVIDMIRYGTGIFYIYPNNLGENIIESVEPLNWYPLPYDMGDVFAIRDYKNDEMIIKTFVPGVFRLQRFGMNGSTIGKEIESRAFTFPMERMIIPCPQRPRSGEWGKAVYFNMIPLVQELMIRLTRTSQILDQHANPVLMLKRDPRYSEYNHNPIEDTEDIQIIEQQKNLFGLRNSNTVVMPPEYVDAHYITWDAQMQASQAQIKEVQAKLFDVTRVPISLSGDFQPITASGAALKRLYSDTYIHIANIQTFLKPKMKEALRLMTGTDYEIEWENPFDLLDRQEIIQGGADDIQGLDNQTVASDSPARGSNEPNESTS